MQMLKRFQRKEYFCLTAVLLVFLLMSLYKLTDAPLWYDEVVEFYYSKYLSGPIQGVSIYNSLYERLQFNSFQPPLYNLIMHVWLLFSESEWWFRFSGVVFGFIGMLGLYACMKMITNWKVAVLSVFVSSFTVSYTHLFNPSYLLIMLFSILFNYCIFRLIISARKKNRMSGIAGSRFWMTIGVLSNLGILFYFKYYDFFIENVNAVFDTSFMLKGILLPLGISFFTFQQIGFVVDSYRGEIESCSFLDYSLFVSFFPQLIAGPIVNHNEMMPQLEQIGHRQMDWSQFTSGVYLFTLGMVKKVLVADTFGKAVNWGYSNVSGLTGVDSALLILFYVLQLYFDFSGYCNMARGLGWLFGIEIPVNFLSLIHISLKRSMIKTEILFGVS